MSAAHSVVTPLVATYEGAIRAVLNVRRMTRLELLGYFHELEQEKVGVVLDDMVERRLVSSLGGPRKLYALAEWR